MLVSHIEGGTCSQINFIIRAMFLQEKGYKVKFDLHWFTMHKKRMQDESCNDSYARVFNVDKLCPDVVIDIASDDEINEAKKHIESYETLLNRYDLFDSLIYIKDKVDDGCKCDIKLPVSLLYFKQFVNPVLDAKNKYWYDIITNDPLSVGFHIRRGDLSGRGDIIINTYVYDPVSISYILKIVSYLYNKNPNHTIYFFSDEINWVRDNVPSNLKLKYHIVDINDSCNGYLDLYLISKCKMLCSSQGSVVYYTMYFGDNPLIIDYKNNKDKYINEIYTYYAMDVLNEIS